jgi:glycerate kinase
MATTTFGTGELLMAAVEAGVKRIILGIGGSATVDGGIGCAQACGLPVILQGGEPAAMTEPLCGRDLDSVVLIKHGRGSPLERIEIVVASDVTNPLFGENGAARIFGPQKGATQEQVAWLDSALRRLSERTGKLEVAMRPGAGAAGGLGFGMMAYFGATLRPGIEIVMDAVALRQRLAGADLCITGEGKMDASSLAGKTPVGVARVCRELGVRCVAVVGTLACDVMATTKEGIADIVAIADRAASTEESMRLASPLVAAGTEELLRRFISHENN